MPFKKTDNCCRYCRYRGWGKTRKHQRSETIVCLKRPKVFSHAVDNIEPHYYATRMIDVCEMFERRDGV